MVLHVLNRSTFPLVDMETYSSELSALDMYSVIKIVLVISTIRVFKTFYKIRINYEIFFQLFVRSVRILECCSNFFS